MGVFNREGQRRWWLGGGGGYEVVMIGMRGTFVMIGCIQSLCLVRRDLESLAVVRKADGNLKKNKLC